MSAPAPAVALGAPCDRCCIAAGNLGGQAIRRCTHCRVWATQPAAARATDPAAVRSGAATGCQPYCITCHRSAK